MAVGHLLTARLYNARDGRVVVNGIEYASAGFPPSHPAYNALDPAPGSYWRTQNGNLGSDSWGTLFTQCPTGYDPTKPVTLKFYAQNVESVGAVATDHFAISTHMAGDSSPRIVPLVEVGGSVWAGSTSGMTQPGMGPSGTPYDVFFSVANPPVEGQIARMEIFHVEVEYTPLASGWRPLRQRQSLIGNGSWPLRQRQNGAHSGSWALRQRQTRT